MSDAEQAIAKAAREHALLIAAMEAHYTAQSAQMQQSLGQLSIALSSGKPLGEGDKDALKLLDPDL